MASVLAVRALHASRVFEEVSTVRTAHDVVECLYREFVTVLLDDVFFLLANGTLTPKTSIKVALGVCLPCEADCKLNATHRLQSEPGVDKDRTGLWLHASTNGAATWRRCALSALRPGWWLELDVRLGPAVGHFVGSGPSCLLEFGLDPLPSKLIHQVLKSNPKKSYRHGVVA